jgi:hypothetical protein
MEVPLVRQVKSERRVSIMIDGNAWRCLLLGLYRDYGWKRFDGAGCQITHSGVASSFSPFPIHT